MDKRNIENLETVSIAEMTGKVLRDIEKYKPTTTTLLYKVSPKVWLDVIQLLPRDMIKDIWDAPLRSFPSALRFYGIALVMLDYSLKNNEIVLEEVRHG
jgi:hypothetical protein